MTAARPDSEPRLGVPARFDAYSYLEANASRAPDSVAVWQDGAVTTFAQLRDLVRGLIDELRGRAIGAESVVAVA
ncbi:MAG: hypothetical protein KGL15_06130, partial [Acidobacteriota bacterium]|nr:hypothetical protein [Acidobacteriota bacterium]